MKHYYFYHAFGLSLSSEILLKELVSTEDMTTPDIKITYGKVPKELDGNNVITKVRNQIAPNQFLLHVDKIARYYACNGNRIVVEKHPEADLSSLVLFLLGPALTAILCQRGYFLLYASAIEQDGKAIVFVGSSGVGKSTTATALVDQGYKLLSDNICLLSVDKSGELILTPSHPFIKLWKDTLEAFHTHRFLDGAIPLRPDLKKYGVILSEPSHYSQQSLPLKKVYILQNKIPELFKIESLNPTLAADLLVNYIYHYSSLKSDSKELEYHLDICTMIANRVPVSLIERFEGDKPLKESITLLINELVHDSNCL